MMNEINYSLIIDDALHYAVKKVLKMTQENGLIGNHHFFISFITSYPGVQLSDRIKNKYPDEITIVIQHQYEDLKVEEDKFSISLSFNNIKENVVVPFSALTAFADPSVKFGLQFRHADDLFKAAKEQSKKIKEEIVVEKVTDQGSASNVISLKSFKRDKKDS